jgi:hypothetical protein
MTTSVESETEIQGDQSGAGPRLKRVFKRLIATRFVRELLIILTFLLLTSAITWPYVTRLKDAVSGRNDPYLTSYVLWWDYHATFNDPRNLFHPQIFYPYPYALAFSEHCYGISLLFFPLFALGFKPLTVHAVAIFFGFALSGYAAFRLARTLTGSYGAAWVAGILFAFVPYHFNMLGQLMYLFAVWVPLLFEALILFTRDRSKRHAAWLAVTFWMLGLSTATWFLLSMIPLAVTAAILLTRQGLWRDRQFWIRSAAALGAASLGLMPFMLPYYIASKMYGFKRRFDEVRAHSALPIHWMVADVHNRLWRGMGEGLYEANKFQMFPGLLAFLLPLTEVMWGGSPSKSFQVSREAPAGMKKWIRPLDVLIVVAFALSIAAFGFSNIDTPYDSLFHYLTSERALALLWIAIVVRLCVAYPKIIQRGEARNLIETIRSDRRSDAFWIGGMLTAIGFFYSLGWNFFFYRFLYDVMPGFKGMRAPMRGALFAYLGLALLAGLGAMRIAERVARQRKQLRLVAYAVVCLLLLFELNTVPLFFIRGEVNPDAVTLRLKGMQMRGGVAYLPFSLDLNHQYTLRAADHLKPIISATSSFNPPYFEEIERLTGSGTISLQLMDLYERIPASYLVVENQLIAPERQADFNSFVAAALKEGRLRFINRFDGHNDLYAVTKTEPETKSAAPIPPELKVREWTSMVNEDPKLIVRYQRWTQALYRLQLASFGELPRYAGFMNDVKSVGRGVVAGVEEQERQFQNNFQQFAEEWTRRAEFSKLYDRMDGGQYVDRLAQNAGINLNSTERDAMIKGLANGTETRATVLLKIVSNQRFVDKEYSRSIVLLHYFAYLKRNPNDPPDHNLDGFNYWVSDMDRNHDLGKLASAFKDSGEYKGPQN